MLQSIARKNVVVSLRRLYSVPLSVCALIITSIILESKKTDHYLRWSRHCIMAQNPVSLEILRLQAEDTATLAKTLHWNVEGAAADLGL